MDSSKKKIEKLFTVFNYFELQNHSKAKQYKGKLVFTFYTWISTLLEQ